MTLRVAEEPHITEAMHGQTVKTLGAPLMPARTAEQQHLVNEVFDECMRILRRVAMQQWELHRKLEEENAAHYWGYQALEDAMDVLREERFNF